MKSKSKNRRNRAESNRTDRKRALKKLQQWNGAIFYILRQNTEAGTTQIGAFFKAQKTMHAQLLCFEKLELLTILMQ